VSTRGAPKGARDREEVPQLLFVERAVRADPITVEVDRPLAMHPRVTGFWRSGTFARVLKIVETRYEHGETYYRVVTDRGCVDLRRFHLSDPQTMRSRPAWEVCADLDAFESARPQR